MLDVVAVLDPPLAILLTRLCFVDYFVYFKNINKKYQTKSFLVGNIRQLALFPNKSDITNLNFSKYATAFLGRTFFMAFLNARRFLILFNLTVTRSHFFGPKNETFSFRRYTYFTTGAKS